MNPRAAGLALLLAGGAVASSASAKWGTVRLQDTSFSISWPKGRGAKWEFNGDQGSFAYKDKDEFGKPLVFHYSVRVVPFSPDEHWDSVLNKESGTDEGALHVDEGQRAALPDVGGDRGAALIEGEIVKGVQATFPTRRWTLAQRDGDGVLRDFRDVFVLRAPAHYVSIRYDYTPPTAHEAGLAVFNRMVRSLGAFDRPRKGDKRGKKKHKKKGAAAAKPAAPKPAPPPAAPAPSAAPESAAPSATPGAPSMPAGPVSPDSSAPPSPGSPSMPGMPPGH